MKTNQDTKSTAGAGSLDPVVGASGQDRLEILTEKIKRGEGLTMAERLERQGIIFNHDGNISTVKIQLT